MKPIKPIKPIKPTKPLKPIKPRLSSRRVLGAVASAVVLTTTVAAASPVVAADADAENHRDLRRVHVNGSARLDYPWAPADDVRFSVHARATFDRDSPAPTSIRASGRARIHHRVAEAGVVAWASGRVECLSTGGRSVTGSMIVTETSPVLAEWRGKRVGFSVLTGGAESRAGWTEPTEPSALPGCVAPAPHLAVDRGRFAVRSR